MDFHADALTDRAFVDAGAERDDRAHIFVARREVLVERLATKDQGRRAVFDDFKIGGADSDGVDSHQNFRALRHGDWLVR